MSIQPKLANSSPVQSAQTEIHPRLLEILQRHQQHLDQTPIADFSQAIWPQAHDFLRSYAGFVLDLGCGTGDSTRALAQKHPALAVLGVDRSDTRLSKRRSQSQPSNALCLRMDQFDLLRLVATVGLKAEISYLLYPNPSPKAEHLKRRWHAHPIFPALLKSSQAVQLRTNWAVYAQEFAAALHYFCWQTQSHAISLDEPPISLFEAKYQASGHGLVRVDGAPRSN